jgi:hypothetical protein
MTRVPPRSSAGCNSAPIWHTDREDGVDLLARTTTDSTADARLIFGGNQVQERLIVQNADTSIATGEGTAKLHPKCWEKYLEAARGSCRQPQSALRVVPIHPPPLLPTDLLPWSQCTLTGSCAWSRGALTV